MLESSSFDGARIFSRAFHQFLHHLSAGNTERVKGYLDQGLPLDFPFNGKTLLYDLIVTNEVTLVREVLKIGANPRQLSGDVHHLESPLETAIVQGSVPVLELLLAAVSPDEPALDTLLRLAGSISDEERRSAMLDALAAYGATLGVPKTQVQQGGGIEVQGSLVAGHRRRRSPGRLPRMGRGATKDVEVVRDLPGPGQAET